MVVQVLAESSDTAIGEPFDLARAVVTLPAGDYRLRVNGKGRVGRTYRFGVNRGETQSHSISIDEGRLLGGEQAAASDRKKGERTSRPGLHHGRVRRAAPEKARLPIPFAPGERGDRADAGKDIPDRVGERVIDLPRWGDGQRGLGCFRPRNRL